MAYFKTDCLLNDVHVGEGKKETETFSHLFYMTILKKICAAKLVCLVVLSLALIGLTSGDNLVVILSVQLKHSEMFGICRQF